MTYPGGGGGQGGWNDQSGWGQQQQGDHQTGGYQTGGYPQTGGFPQQQQGYGGLGVYGGFGGEPPKKSKKTLWLVLGAVVLVLLVLLAGGGVTWFLLSRGSDDPNAQNNPSAPASASSQPTDKACPRNEGMQCVDTSLGYTYEIPKNWDIITSASIAVDKFPGISLTGVSVYGDYTCENKPYTKGTNGGALLPKGDINKTATDFTKAVATQFYASGGEPQVTLSQPKQVKIQHTQKNGQKVVVEGVQVDATITQSANKCLASKGVVKVIVLDGSNRLHTLVVNGDVEGGGGGTNPPLPKESELQKMIDSLAPTT